MIAGYALMRRARPRDATLIYTLALRVHPEARNVM